MHAVGSERLRATDQRARVRASRPHRAAAPQHPVLQLQTLIGNRQVTALLGKEQVQRKAATGAAFDPKDVRNDLIRAIDTTVIAVPGGLSSGPTYLPRKVDVSVAVSALEGLTPEQVGEVRRAYLAHEGRTLDHDLFGAYAGGTNLTPANRARLQALLHYDSADTAALTLDLAGVTTEQILATTASIRKGLASNQAGLATDQLRADAAELRQLLTDDPNDSERERIMKLLRNDAARNDQMAVQYHDLFSTDLRTDIRKYLDEAPAARAMLLAAGDKVGADGLAVEERAKKIAALNDDIARVKRQSDLAAVAGIGWGGSSAVNEAIRKKLEEKRAEQVAAVESTLEAARQEATGEADAAHKATAGAERVSAILGRATAGGGTLAQSLAAALTSKERAVVRALEAGSPPKLAAARLMQALMDDKQTPALAVAELRGLREAATQDARAHLLAQLAALGPNTSLEERQEVAEQLQAKLPEATEVLSKEYFDQLRDSYNANFPKAPGVPSDMFASMVQSFDDKGETKKLAGLVAGQGRLDDIDELLFALDGDHEDIETVKRVLGKLSPDKRRELVASYDARTHRSLRTVLLGTGKPRVDLGDTSFLVGLAAPAAAAALAAPVGGKATGHDAFVVRELLDEPFQKGGVEEAEFLATQADKERDWAVDDSGVAGSIHDWGGSETRGLMDETANVALWDLWTYKSLLAAGRLPDAQAMLEKIRQERQRLRHDRAAYSSSVDEFRSKLSAALTLAVDIAIMVALPEAAPFLVGLATTVAGHVAVNVVLYGDKYDASMLQKDVLGAIGSAAGSKLAELALAGKVVGGAADLGEDLAVTASKTIVREAPEVASKSVVDLAKREALALGKEAVTQTAGSVGGGIATGDVNVSPGEVAKGILVGKAGKGLRQVVRGGGGHETAAGKGDRPGRGDHPDESMADSEPGPADVRQAEDLEASARNIGSSADGVGTLKETPVGEVIICHSPCLLIEKEYQAELRANKELRARLNEIKELPEGTPRVEAERQIEMRLEEVRRANLEQASEAVLRKRIGDPAAPRDVDALGVLVGRYEGRSVRELVEMRRSNKKWQTPLAAEALQHGRPAQGTLVEYRTVGNLDALREMARYDPVAHEELIDRYRRMSPTEREAAATIDETARYVEPIEGPQMDRDAEARLAEGIWEQRRTAMEQADRREAAARAGGDAAAAATAAQDREAARTGGTVGVLETTIPGIDEQTVRGSPNAPAEGAEPGVERLHTPPSTNPQSQFHAEENLLNLLEHHIAEQVQQGMLREPDLEGHVVRIAVDQEICQSCLSGVAQSEHAGVLTAFSAHHPGLRVEITDIRTGDFTVFEGGLRTVNNRRTIPIAADQR